MSRRTSAVRRVAIPDAKYHDRTISRFISVLMLDGKKSTAESILYGAFDIIEHKLRADPLVMFRRALENVRPRVEVKSRRVGGATYQVPIEVRPERASSLAMRWLSSYARSRAGRTMTEKLASEIMDAANERGEAVRKR